MKNICAILVQSLNGAGSAIFSAVDGKFKLSHYDGIPKPHSLLNSENIDSYCHKYHFRKPVSFVCQSDNHKYKIFVFGKGQFKITPLEYKTIKNLLNTLLMVIAIRRLSKNRVIETQIINEFNLNIITTMDETRIIENLEKAARRLLDTEKILFFYLKKDKLIGADFNLDINKLSKKSYEQFFIAKRIFIANFNELKTLKRRLDIKSKAPCIFVPFTIKNKFRGFFVFYAKIKPHMQSVIITRLKFLSNQAALVLEKIELFQALTQALKESDGLQELAKIMLSSLDISSLFNEILKRAQSLLGYRRILFSRYNPITGCFDRISGVGITQRKLREAKEIHPSFKSIKKLLQDRHRRSNSYYIPSNEVSGEIRDYELFNVNHKKAGNEKLWDPGDILLSPIYSKSRELVGYLSLDKPSDNLAPSLAKIRLLESFGDFLGMTIENARLFKEIERLSITDELTGIYNYRFLRTQLTRLIKKKAAPTAILIIDLDNFKRYNDKFGHLFGDEILKNFSQILVEKVGEVGSVIRYGGDEFIILLPGMSFNGVGDFAKKLERSYKKFTIDKRKITLTASYGIAVYPSDGKHLGELIDRADNLLYLAKAKKRYGNKK